MHITDDLTSLKGVGDKLAEKLAKLGLASVQDLLFHLPLRYQDKTRVIPIADLLFGQDALIEGEIISQHMTKTRNSSLLVKIADANGQILSCRFFHFHYRQAQQFKRGQMLRAYGEVRNGPTGLEMVHPSYQLFNPQNPPPLETTLTPVYPTTEGLGQASLLKLIDQALECLKENPLAEILPDELLNDLKLPGINQALLTLHKPQASDDLYLIKGFQHPSQQRLIVEELLSSQLALQLMRQQEKAHGAPSFATSPSSEKLLQQLPFELTSAQQRVLNEISDDLSMPHPMQRLVQGDVGSGKTVIAALAALYAADNGHQVVVMAPTEILAEQHLNAFLEWLEPLNIKVAWLNGRMKAAERRYQMALIESGEAQVVIGTHALFQDAVVFNQLGLVIIDEQHRFGVHQRLALQQKGKKFDDNGEEIHPHQLVMTATPIPRTLAMTAYGDLDLSIIDELPPGRKPIETAVINNEKRFEIMQHLYAKCKQGVQAYWVCPLIEESELLHAQAAEVTATQFSDNWPDLRIGLVHGRLKGEEKALVMNAFKNHQLDLLVATTVIEVGVNVPNASLMIIENAERLGLAQLHQLRGRVGRGDLQSHCVLLYQAPLSETGKARLNIMRDSNDGFVIAEEDLKIRGPGEILGTRQTGGLQFRIADLKRDAKWIPTVQKWAQILSQSNRYNNPLQARWIGHRMDYQHA
ncbi:ATP-dependent DNA helicase RecG [Thiomicrorhabdus sediminis]|uniref:ATP-dependent DNA helicase RecG n=1 Tax=Thiomicrorhabdus sediminis TaxID=2580412 RepID=A0A4P9K9L6_9GAMM|nr:ATP-dependent DNA helicase RecG [Thiomicrorhabdus sediminis]QCU91027.1 ATP-dependent DNA helicase RecG [Thiomicrorhabdus sediminis]